MPRDEEQTKKVIKAFKGLHTNADPRDIDETEATVMNNITTVIPGQLTVRKGFSAATFANNQAAVAYGIIGSYRYQSPLREYCIYQTADGSIRAGYTAT